MKNKIPSPKSCIYCASLGPFEIEGRRKYFGVCRQCGHTGPYGDTPEDAWRLWNMPNRNENIIIVTDKKVGASYTSITGKMEEINEEYRDRLIKNRWRITDRFGNEQWILETWSREISAENTENFR